MEGGRGEGKSRERTMPRRAELSEPFSLAFTGEEGGSAPAPPRGEAFPAGDQRRPEHAAVGEQHQLVFIMLVFIVSVLVLGLVFSVKCVRV